MAVFSQIQNRQLRDALRFNGLRQVAFMPLAADNDWFLESTAPTSGANKTTTIAAASLTKAYCPGWPVVLVGVVTENAGDTFTAVSLFVQGLDQFGMYRQETIAFTNSSATWTGTGAGAFCTLISIALTITGTVDANDRFILGFAKTYGIGVPLVATADVIATLFDGAADSGTISLANTTYAIADTPNAAKHLIILVRPRFGE